MCLALQGRIVELSGSSAVVDFGGVSRVVDVSLLDSCKVGDVVLVHVGFAIQKVVLDD